MVLDFYHYARSLAKSSWNSKKPKNSTLNPAQKPEKSSWNSKNPQNSTPNPAVKPEKTREKVAETAEIPKTAPQTQP